MFLEKMRWPEVAALPRDKVVTVFCISALEQHSLHLPMGTDFFIGRELVRRLEAQFPDGLLCLPVVWFGSSSHHMDFAGTISATPRTMTDVLRDVAASIHAHGFRKLLLLNSHGGNRALLARSLQELGQEIPDLQIAGATYWDLAKDELSAIRETPFGGMGHACELETSIILAIHGDLTDMTKAEVDGGDGGSASRFTRGEMLSPSLVETYKSFKSITRNGGFGDPTLASAEKGERMLDAIVRGLRALCEDFFADRLWVQRKS
jgi:creatinine amidohydrolase